MREAGFLSGGPVLGTVVAFDTGRGLGTVAGDDGREWGFHCTSIADGSRSIEAGTRVAFVVASGHTGREEARGVTPVPR